MAGPLYYARVMETSTTTGTGTYTLAGAVTGYQTWAAVGNSNTAYYCAVDVDSNGNPAGGWEEGLGTYTSSGTTLARTAITASSNSGSAVSWSAGTRRISLVQPSVRIPGIYLLEEHVGSGAASLDFTARNVDGQSGATIQSDFDLYVVELINIRPSTNTQDLRMRVSTDGGSTYDSGSNYYDCQIYVRNDAATGVLNVNPSTAITLFTAIDNASTSEGVNGTVKMQNPGGSTYRKSMLFDITATQASFFYRSYGGIIYNSATAVNAFQFYFASGNINGTARVYGLRKTQ